MENRLIRRDKKNAKETEHQTAIGSDFLYRRLIYDYGMCINRSDGGEARRKCT